MKYLVRFLDQNGYAVDWLEMWDWEVEAYRKDGHIEGKHFTLEKLEEPA